MYVIDLESSRMGIDAEETIIMGLFQNGSHESGHFTVESPPFPQNYETTYTFLSLTSNHKLSFSPF